MWWIHSDCTGRPLDHVHQQMYTQILTVMMIDPLTMHALPSFSLIILSDSTILASQFALVVNVN